MSFEKGDRVQVNESCSWKWRHGDLGTVVEVSEEFGSVWVKLDEESENFQNGATATFYPSSLDGLPRGPRVRGTTP